MADCKPTPTPLPKGTVLGTDMQPSPIDTTYYCKLVKKLIFITVTRLDLAYAVSRVSSYMANLQVIHLNAVKHILQYIQGTLDYGLTYQAGRPIEITDFTDTDYGNCVETRCSTEVYIFTIGGGPISWPSKR